MSTTPEATTNYSLFYTLAIVAFVLTFWVVSASVIWSLFGGIIGLLFAAFFVNVLVKDRD